jgi:hypothetical protein
MCATLFITTPTHATFLNHIPIQAIEPSSIAAFRDIEPIDRLFNDGIYTNNATTAWFPVHRSTTSRDVARTAFEFDLSQIGKIHSATLLVSYSFAINTPSLELHGYYGDGIATQTGVINDNLLETLYFAR